MNVWIVFFRNFQDVEEFIGAYSTEEKALERIAQFGRLDQRSLSITKYELDSD